MATFYVGQRVRVVRVRDPVNRGHIGAQCRIVRFRPEGHAVLDCYPLASGANCIQLQNIEPILPEGHKPSEHSFTELMDRLRSGVVS